MRVAFWISKDKKTLNMSFYKEENGKLYVANTVELDWKEHPAADPIPSCIAVDAGDEDFAQSLADASDRAKIDLILGELLHAKEEHINDLREIIKSK